MSESNKLGEKLWGDEFDLAIIAQKHDIRVMSDVLYHLTEVIKRCPGIQSITLDHDTFCQLVWEMGKASPDKKYHGEGPVAKIRGVRIIDDRDAVPYGLARRVLR